MLTDELLGLGPENYAPSAVKPKKIRRPTRIRSGFELDASFTGPSRARATSPSRAATGGDSVV
jgi:hypothetical protein